MKTISLSILTFGVFSIINTEMGIIGILPLIATNFNVSISKAGLLISLFALVVAISGPTMPLLFSGVDRKKAMILVQAIFLLSTIFSAFTTSFTALLISRIIPAFFHPIYCSLAFAVAGNSVKKSDAPKAVSKVLMGVSAGMVLGVPIVSFIASVTSLQIAMLSFVVVNMLALLATIFFVPNMPVTEKLSYGTQLGVLKNSVVWISIATVILLNGAVFGVYSFFAEYLGVVTDIPTKSISLILLIYGISNIIGNIIAGRLLSQSAVRFVISFPFALIVVYIILLLIGELTVAIIFITLLWGILAGAGANINQYWLISAAPDAPDFANGLFLSSANLGTTIGTTICGFFIAGMGSEFVMIGGIILTVFSIGTIFLRVHINKIRGV